MSRHLKGMGLALCALAFAVSVAGCPGGGEEEPRDPCEGVVCGAGSCVASEGRAACECDPGYHAEGLTCVKDDDPPKNPCEPNPCLQPGRRVCLDVGGRAVCGCDPGTQEGPNGTCVIPNPCDPNPCTLPNKTDCSVSDGQAICSCVSGYVPEGDGCRPEQTVSCTGQHSTGDSFEPDECPTLARALGASGTQNEEHTLSPVGDEDWLKLTAVAGHIYEAVATGAAGERLDLDLYAADGTTVLASDHSGQATAKLVHKAVADGELFFRIRAFVSGETGAYTLSIVDLGADDFADDPARATELAEPFGTPVPGALQFDGDRDVVKLPLAAGHSYRFEAAWSATSTDSLRLELIAPDQTTVVVSSQQVAPQALTRITSPGGYFLRIQEPTGKLRAGYTFTATDLGVDDHGDGPGESSPVIIDAPPEDGGFERPDDVDVFSFQAQAGHIYAFTCNPSGGATDCHVSLSDAAGNVLATDNNGGTGYIVHEYAQAGTYFFRLSSGGAGSYTYRLEDLGFDDYGDTLETATAVVPVSTPTSARLEVPGDVDFLKFEVEAERIYSVTCTSAAFPCAVELQDGAGTMLVSGTASSDSVQIRHTFSAAGTVYLRISSSTAGAMGSYTWRVESQPADDHGDTIDTATPITAGGAGSGQLEEVGDVDVFGFTATAGHIYRFTCSGSSLDCDAELLDADGAVLVSANGPETTALITHEFNTGGAYYFRVRTDAATAGGYTYSLEDLGVDDHGDTAGTATALTVPASGSGRLEPAGDVDVFSFSGSTDEVFEFTCTGTSVDCNVLLVNSSGVTVASDTASSANARIVYRLPQAGTWFLHVMSTPTGTGSYGYQLVNLGTDEHGDTPSTATPVVVDAPAAGGRIDTPVDVDVFSFDALANHIYEITCTSTALTCELRLMNGAGIVLASDNGASAKVVYEVGAAGAYYFRVASASSAAGTYSYRVVDLGVDDHGDTLATATSVTPTTTSNTGRVETLGDADWFSFSGAANTVYEFTCSSSAIDCDVVLYNSSGTVLQSDTGTSTSAKVTYLVRSAATFFVKVVSGTTTIGAYTWQLKDLGTDDHGNTLSDATPVTPSTTASNARINASGDVDVFSFTAEAGHIYEIECTSGAIDCDVVWMDSAGTVVASDTTSSSTARLRLELNTAGTYYFRVQAGGSAFGNYAYRLRDLGVDDHGDTLATATPIAPMASTATGQIETYEDVDVFAFSATAGHIYEFTCTGAAGDCDLYLVDGTGAVLIQDTGSSSSAKVAYEIGTAGTYYLRLLFGTASTTVIGGYTYQLKELGVDDHGDTLATATPITPSTTASTGQIETRGDLDYFSFSGEANTTYEFSCSSSAIDCNLVLYDSTGTALQSDAGTSTSAKVTYLVRVAGTFSVRVYSGTATIGAYTWQLKNLGTDDHGNTLSDATPVTPSTTASNARIDAPGDVDVFSFVAEAGHIYEAECNTSAFDCDLVLMDATGTVIRSDTGTSSSASVRVELGTAGTYYFRIQPGGTAFGAYSYRLRDLGVDDHGDTQATATPIAPSTTRTTALFEVSGDVDWFSFTAEAGHIYEFTCIAAWINCNVYLYNAEGTVLDSDIATSSTARVRLKLTTAGTYSLRAVAFDWSTTNGYTYQLRDLGVDDHGDTQATATPIAPSTTSTPALFEVSGDVDWFSFTAEAGHIYEFTCIGAWIDCNVYLYNAEGTLLVSSTSTSTTARVRLELNTAGTYSLRAVAADWSTTNGYTYQLRDLGVDDHGDTQATATPIVPSTTNTQALFEVSGDVDWFSFTAEAGHIYEFTCIGASIDCDVYLYDAAGTLVVSDRTTSTTARVRLEFSTAGTYSLRAVAADWSTTNGYTYQLRDLGVDDHGDAQATATPIVPSTTSTPALFEVSGDVDWFSFTAEAGHIYEFTCNGSSLNCNLYLYDAEGTLLVSDTDTSNSASVRREFTTAGSFYLRAVAANWSTSNGYTYQLRDLGVDDYGDTQATATPIVPSTASTTALFEVSGDVDWFSFTAEAGHIYEFICDGYWIDCNVYLYDAAGTLVVSNTSTGNTAARVEAKLTTAGTYYLRAVAFDWYSTRVDYTYQLSHLGAEDHGDTFSAATALTLGTATAGNIEISSDVDFFAVDLASSTGYTLTPTGILRTFTVYAPDQTTVLYTGSGPTTFTSVAGGGTHYVRVQAILTGAYTIKVQ